MYKPLIIDCNYSVINNAAGQISRTFWEHVDKNNFNPTIVTGDETSLGNTKNRILKVHDRGYIRHSFGLISKIGFNDICLIPDRKIYSWNPFAYKCIMQDCKSQSFDYIHSISSPQSAHLLGLKLKNKLGIPWIAQFDDPWHDASGRNYKIRLFNNYDMKLEEKVAHYADVIIHSNQVIKDIWIERYGEKVAKKIVIVPFSFNTYNLPIVTQPIFDGKLVISHIGHIYSTRSSMTFLKAIIKLKNSLPDLCNNLHVNFIGGIHQSEKDFAIYNQLSDIVSFIHTLPPEQLDSYYQKSNMFLIIDVNIKRSPNYPSKLMMYYYYQRPIIGITNPGSQLEFELNSTGHHCVYYNDVEGMTAFLLNAITDYRELLSFNTKYWQRHTVENVEEKYKAIVNSLFYR